MDIQILVSLLLSYRYSFMKTNCEKLEVNLTKLVVYDFCEIGINIQHLMITEKPQKLLFF